MVVLLYSLPTEVFFMLVMLKLIKIVVRTIVRTDAFILNHEAENQAMKMQRMFEWAPTRITLLGCAITKLVSAWAPSADLQRRLVIPIG